MELLDALRREGADVDGALTRFMGDKALYEKFLRKLPGDENYAELVSAIRRKDAEAIFRHAHTLKGLYGTLGLTKLFETVSALTERSRHGEAEGCDVLLAQLVRDYEKFEELLG